MPPSQTRIEAVTTQGDDQAGHATPWWKVPVVWLVVGGPLSVVVASLVTAAVAWTHIDPVITNAPGGPGRAGDEVAAPANPKDALAPALAARNHAASPQR